MEAQTKAPTRRDEIEQQIIRFEAEEGSLVEEAFGLGQREAEAQRIGDVRGVLKVRARADELSREIGAARASRNAAQADLEEHQARELERQAEPFAEQMRALEGELEQLQGELSAVRDQRDSHLQAAKHHRLQATRYRHQSHRLTAIHDPRKQEPLS